MDVHSMDIIFESYIKREDNTIILDDLIYYRIIAKMELSIKDCTVIICIPKKIFENDSYSFLVDENGKVFKIGEPAIFSFRGDIPKWYLETYSVPIEGIKDLNEIGEYLTPYYEYLLNHDDSVKLYRYIGKSKVAFENGSIYEAYPEYNELGDFYAVCDESDGWYLYGTKFFEKNFELCE